MLFDVLDENVSKVLHGTDVVAQIVADNPLHIRCISGHLEDVGGICPLSSDDPWRAAPSALGRHMPAAQLQARGITEILTAAAKNALHTSGTSGALPPSLCTASRGF